MKSQTRMLIAFILNFLFSIFEVVGGILTNSISLISDAFHDFGDAFSIGIATLLEKKSKRQPDDKYTFGYARFSILGSVFLSVFMLIGAIIVVYNAVLRIINPVPINYNALIIFAVIGVIVNFVATFITHGGHSLNQKGVSLHMLEDLFGWIVVLIGAVVMRFTDLYIIDPILSICVSVFLIVNVILNLKEGIDIFLAKTPKEIDIAHVKEHLEQIEGVKEIHHLHIWSLDAEHNYATLHAVKESDCKDNLIEKINLELAEFGICHSTIQIEDCENCCQEKNCHVHFSEQGHSHHGHHHSHHGHQCHHAHG